MLRTISFDFDAFPWADEPVMVTMYMYLLCHAATKPCYYHETLIERGQIAVSTRKLAAALGISMQSVRTAIRKFSKLGYITKTANHKMTILTITWFDEMVSDESNGKGGQNEESQAPAPVKKNDKQEINPEQKKEEPVYVEEKQLPVSKTLDERKHDFGRSLVPFVGTSSGKYCKTMIRAFYDFWSASLDGKTMRCESDNFKGLSDELKAWDLQHSAKKGKFTPPTIQEVKEYIFEKGYSIDADTWWNFYNSKGWFVGKNKMSNWKSAIATWAKNQKEYGNNRGNYQQVQQGKQQRLDEAAAMVNRLLSEASEDMAKGTPDPYGYL